MSERRFVALAFVTACATSPAPPPPAPPVPVVETTRGCADAAAGLERATIALRAPDVSVLQPMRSRCVADAWSVRAVECFATMKVDDLGTCARELATPQREAMFAVIGGTTRDDGAIGLLVARLAALKVGIHNCDRFVAAVSTMLGCPGMPLETRLQLGAETADFWSLPTAGLPITAQARMAAACGHSLAALQQQALDVGCMP